MTDRRHHFWGSSAPIAAITAMAMLSVPRAAQADDADPPVRMGMFPIQVQGELEDHWKDDLQEKLRDGITRAGPTVVAAATVVAKAQNAPTCDTAACFEQAAERIGVDYFLRFSVGVVERDFETRLELVDGRTGTVVARNIQACEMCGIAEVGDLLADQAASLVGELQARLDRPTVLRIESMPRRAKVWIDDRPVGTTPLTHPTEPGYHRIHLQRRGYEPRAARIRTTPGVEETVRFDLNTSMKRTLYMRAWGWTALGVGLASVVAGGVLIGLDDKPYQGQCSGDNIDALDRCRFQYNTLTGGALATTGGVGLLATGIILLVISAKAKAKAKPKTQAKAKPKPTVFRF